MDPESLISDDGEVGEEKACCNDDNGHCGDCLVLGHILHGLGDDLHLIKPVYMTLL